MRLFNPSFIAEKNKRAPNGPAPRNLVEFGFAAAELLSDSDIAGATYPGANLVSNGDMELDSVWLDDGSFVTTNERSNEQAFGGAYSRKLVVGHGTSGIKNSGARFTTVTGTTYRITCRVYRPGTNSSPIHTTIRNGADTADIVSQTSAGLTLGVWTTLTYEFTETAGGSQAYVTISAETGTTTYIDAVVVETFILTVSPEQLSNGDMELDSVWVASSGYLNERSTEQVYGGIYSRKFAANDGNYTGITNEGTNLLTPTVTGDDYQLNLWVYRESTAAVFVSVYKGDGSGVISSGFYYPSVGTWQKITIDYTESAGGSGAFVRVFTKGIEPYTVPSVVYVDDISLKATIGSQWDWDGINLLPNGDMELDSGWLDDGVYVGTNERSAEQVYEGTYSRKLVVSALAAGVGGIKNSSNRFTTETGKIYQLTCRVYRPSGTSPVGITIRNGDDTADIVSLTESVTVGSWQLTTHLYTETAGGSQAYARLNADSDTTTYFDDVEIKEQVVDLAAAGLVKSWGFIDSSAGQVPGRSVVGQFEAPDLSLVIINSQASRFSDHSTASDPIEGVKVTLYQWFEGTDLSEKEPIFVGVVRGQPEYDELEHRLTVKGIWAKYNTTIGSDLLISEDDYPDADPDDIGKMANIGYGQITRAQCRALDSGAVDNLAGAIDESQTSIELSDASEFPTSGTAGFDEEQITWTGKSGNTLTPCVRGANGTTASTHAKASYIWEIQSEYVYQLAGHPVQAIGDLYVDGYRVTPLATLYTGQPGDEKAGYAGQAIAVLPARITFDQAVDLLVNDGMTIEDAIDVIDGIDVVDGITISDTIGVSDTIDVDTGSHSHSGGTNEIITWEFDTATEYAGVVQTPERMIDGNFSGGGILDALNDEARFHIAFDSTPSGTPYKYRICVTLGEFSGTADTVRIGLSGGGYYFDRTNLHENTTYKGNWSLVPLGLNTWAEWNAAYAYAKKTAGSYDAVVMMVWVEIEVTPAAESSDATGVAKTGAATKTGASSKSGTASKSGAATKGGTVTRSGVVSLSGNSVADVEIGQVVYADFDGWEDDASGSITGSAYALIERPGHVIAHLLTNYCGFPAVNLGSSFAASDAFYLANNYVFTLLINQQIGADELLMLLGVQCRSRFLISPIGIAQLIVRQLGQASVHSIPKNEIRRDSMSIRRSAEDDLVNTFNIFWNRDRLLSGDDAYKGTRKFVDATSVSRYGTREPSSPGLFYFDAVTDSAMVDDVGAYWLSFLKDSRCLPTFAVFLDNLEVEPGDIIDVTHPLDNMAGFVCEVIKTRNVLGSAKRNVLDRIEILAVEN